MSNNKLTEAELKSLMAEILNEEAADRFFKMSEGDRLIALLLMNLKFSLNPKRADLLTVAYILQELMKKDDELTGALIVGFVKMLDSRMKDDNQVEN